MPELQQETLDHAFDRAAGSRAVPGNRVDLLFDGPATFEAMHRLIAGATRRIHLENYIIHGDRTGSAFAEHLATKAREGVRVRVLYDWFGSLATPRAFWSSLRKAGVEVSAFGPPRLRDPLLLISRNHRKLLVVDGERAVTGGLCIGDEWQGDPVHHRQPWRDTAVEVAGPAARLLDAAFARTWGFSGGTAWDDSREVPAEVAAAGTSAVRVVATEPGRERAYRVLDLLMGICTDRIWITDPYLAAPQRLYQAFQDAASAGTDVRLLLPSSSDIRLVRNLSRVGYRALLRRGVRIWEWRGPMLHAKTTVCDGRWLRVGSSNLNPSSLLANWELDVLLEDPKLADALEMQFSLDTIQASEVKLRPREFPRLLGRAVPERLARELPPRQLPEHVRTPGERRRGALVTAGGLIRGARAALFGPLALLCLLGAALFAIFPTIMAVAASVATGLAGVLLLVRALGHRGRG